MNKSYFSILLISGLFGILLSCRQSHSKSSNTLQNSDTVTTTNDSIAVEAAFELLKKNADFQQSLAMEYEDQFNGEGHPQRMVFGDINSDGLTDALLRFTVEGRGGGNNSDAHYAVFLSEENQWKYNTHFEASIFADDRFLAIDKIENGIIKGNWMGEMDKSLTPYAAEYIFKNNQIINTFTALHQTEMFLSIDAILTSDYIIIPLTGNLKTYEQLLGKGQIVTPSEQPECGSYFEEGTISYLEYSNLQFELNDENEAVVISLKFKNGLKLQTDKGTINEDTKMEDLKGVFQQNDSYMILDEDKNFTLFSIPDGAESDNQWRFTFDKKGNLISLSLFIPC